MIIYKQFEKKYEKEIYQLVFNTMKEELNVSLEQLIDSIKDLKDISKNYIESGGNFWIAIDILKNKIVGTVSIKMNKDIVEFKRYYVQKEYRNKGIGYKLYKIAEKYAKDNFINEIYLVSGKELSKAHRIYEMNGWKKVDAKKMAKDIYIREGAYLYKKELKYLENMNYKNAHMLKSVLCN